MSRNDDVLSHSTRAELLDHIISNPGIRFRDLMEYFFISEGTLRHHLRVLIKDQRIRSYLRMGRRCYYPSDYQPSHIEWELKMESIRLDEKQRKVMSKIEDRTDINQKDLARVSGLGRFRMRIIVKKLIDLGFIRTYHEGREVHYILTSREEIRRKVLRALVTDLLRGNINEETYIKARKTIDEELF